MIKVLNILLIIKSKTIPPNPSILILLISFMLDSIVSNLVPLHSLFTPLFSLVSLIVVYPFFYGDKKKFLIYSGIYGFLYDIVYTNTIFVNTFTLRWCPPFCT